MIQRSRRNNALPGSVRQRVMRIICVAEHTVYQGERTALEKVENLSLSLYAEISSSNTGRPH